ncbi:AfsA-related hotdog domain-containing protein [Nocardia brasiliensis]|uniref:AfsA-related hotdog domain-containing protein n=1 Tax=Nocardia brasiliensis TaxID=37326 RepID=UPI0036705EC9
MTVETLSFEQTVPRTLAHRRCLGEVFVADTAALGPEEFLAAIQIPRAHSHWSDHVAAYHDPLAAVEAIRQAMTVIGHRYLRVPLGTPMSLQRMETDVEDHSALREDGSAPLEGIVRVHAPQIGGTGGYFADNNFTASLTIGAALAMVVRGSGIAFPREAYEQFRRHQQQTRPAEPDAEIAARRPVQPARVGRRDSRNVVVGLPRTGQDSALVLPLVVDQRHPSFFDHAYDHLPGPLILEGFRQAAVLAACETGALATPVVAIAAIHATFTGFAELDADADFGAAVLPDAAGGAVIELELSQFGTTIAACTVELAPYPPD